MALTFNKSLVLGKKAVFNPDVFTAVGNPKITLEGIYSNPSVGNYILCNYTRGNSFEMNAKVNCSDFTANNSMNTIFCFDAAFAYILRFEINHLAAYAGSGTGWDLAQKKGTAVFEENKDYWIKAGYDGYAYTVKVSEDGINWVEDIKSVTPRLCPAGNLALGINPWKGSERPFNGAIDLKTVKLYSDGQEVFSGSKLITPEWEAEPFKFDVNSIN